jgi:hypothetical protein
MLGEQFQRICDAGGTGISESRGLHFRCDLPNRISAFSWD